MITPWLVWTGYEMTIIMSRLESFFSFDQLESVCIQGPGPKSQPNAPTWYQPFQIHYEYIKKTQSFHSLNGIACSISVMYSLICASILRYSS